MFAELLRARLAGVAVLSPEQVNALEAHYGLLVRWNRVLNLTAVRRLPEAVERHYCESVFLAVHLPAGRWSVADVGSGPGFPGVPLAIMRPECSVALIEAHQRKAVFLREATRGLPNVRVVAARAEAVGDRFDWAVSRAVRVEEAGRALARLAPNFGLLAGEEEPAGIPGVEWERPVRLPWGERRVLWLGSRAGGMDWAAAKSGQPGTV